MGRPVQVEGAVFPQQQLNGITHGCAWEASRCPSDLEADPVALSSGWDSVLGLDSQQILALQKVSARGVFWQHPSLPISKVFALSYGGDVDSDGNCLFTAVQIAMQLKESPLDVRLRTVRRFLEDYEAKASGKEEVDKMIKNLYSPDLATGWGVHVVQELKLLAKKSEREALETEIQELMQVGMSRESATESVYKERCVQVAGADSWAKYMSVSGGATDEYDIVTLLYTEDGLLSAESNAEGKAAAFGDDIAIQALANEFKRQIFVVQAHGKDVSMAAENSEGMLFFLPHCPEQEIGHPPVFLLMRGTGWCGAGGDHYEPMLVTTLPLMTKEKAGFIL